MMLLPLADVLQNCLQNLTSRIAGMNNEQMSNRVMGMGTMLGFGMGAIKEQFKSPIEKVKNSNNTDNNSSGGFKGFVSRAKSVISPSMNLSPEKDYNGNVNPIRDVLPKEKTINSKDDNKNNNINANKNDNENSSNKNSKKTNVKSVIGKVAKTGISATKAYLEVGAKMAEGDFSNSTYKTNKNSINNNLKNTTLQNTEYINKMAENNKSENNSDKESGDLNEHKE